MKEYIKERVKQIAHYIIETGSTVRETAKHVDVSKSTVHKDVTDRLLIIDKDLHDRVGKVLEQNLQERHLRGGEATKQKFKGKHH